MPVPESDGNLAIHTIPTSLKEAKSGNTVKFSKVDSYHEYRSRHKHTPPTKDTNPERPSKRVVETVLIQKDDDDSTDCSSISSDTSSVQNLNLERKREKQPDETMSEADRIIIYKILESKLDKSEKKKKKQKLINDVSKVLRSMNKDKLKKTENDDNNNEEEKLSNCDDRQVEIGVQNTVSLEQVNEGVYKVVNEKGLSYNVTSCYTANVEMWQSTAEHKPWWDNITSLYFSDKPQQTRKLLLTDDDLKHGRPCCCKKVRTDQQSDKGTNLHCGNGDLTAKRNPNCLGCKCGCNADNAGVKPRDHNTSEIQPSAATSTSSFKTAKNDKALGALPDGGYIKLVDDDGQEAGKFYIGASGFLRDDAYEVIIQLRKKESAKKDNEKETSKNPQDVLEKVEETKDQDLVSSQSKETCSVNEIPELIEINPNDEIIGQGKQTDKISPLPTPSSKKTNDGAPKNTVTQVDVNDNEHVSSESTSEPVDKTANSKKYVDKGVYTTSQLSYAIPSHVPKTDPISRPATSTYTQTSIESPNQRPVFMHMSSSTSTAYMSPPEMILPKYLKQGYNTRAEKLQGKNENCKNENCRSKRCKCHKTSAPCRKTGSAHKILTTPPNTARYEDDSSDIWVHELDPPVQRIHSRKCHKFDTNNRQGHSKTKINVPIPKHSSHNVVMRVTSSTASTFRNKNSKIHKSDLNPVIKKYINRLLELNRDGIKAIEVANQECSSVTTPGSSIVEVPTNINDKKLDIQHKISLEQIKNDLKQKILEEYVKESTCNNSVQTLGSNLKPRSSLYKLPKKRSVHKVKSLNISKRLINTKKSNESKTKCSATRNMKSNPSTSSPSSAREVFKKPDSLPNKTKSRSKSSPTPRQYPNFEFPQKSSKVDSQDSTPTDIAVETNRSGNRNKVQHINRNQSKSSELILPFNKSSTTSPESETNMRKRPKSDEVAANISTQTSQDLDGEINLMKLAEDKLQNMEKIADLTEKCTKRLSNLAKVLEEVRRNKSLAYSQISTSDTASDSEQKPAKSSYDSKQFDSKPELPDKIDPKFSSLSSENHDSKDLSDTSEYIPFLTNIPKPTEFKYPAQPIPENHTNIKPKPLGNSKIDNLVGKNRGKPPPALSRIHLKNGQDIVPHELSTVVEVDSPMSVKLKNQSSRNNTNYDVPDSSFNNNVSKSQKENEELVTIPIDTEYQVNPDLLQSNNMNVNVPKQSIKRISSTDSSDDSKAQMMDLKQFNELMLKPFISIQEFAKQCDIGALDDGSNLEDNPKDDLINDEMSSLHSDGSLPDVIAELLKRNIITEPFKFDTVNSTTVSSESTLSVLALSKVRKEKKKSSVVFQNKENVSETSDSLSISSNPDLENAFKKLGMGWASSTLKKTKERLALSSSSNTSSSSLSQFKLKGLNNQDIPALVTDSMSSATKISKRPQQDKHTSEISKNAEQQTSFMNSMTVKEFLTNELAKKITFTNKSHRNDTEEEFVSLFETKMPEEMKHLSQTIREERSMDSLPSGHNRARTSTPVQLFKSMTYHSSSSSNMSNGLFSNADDLSSVKVTSNSIRNHSTSDKDDLTIPNCSLKRKGASDCSKSE
ncbi:uncharacterized protein LOC135084250 isoform X1 [Ostrinia nubilalis]|uniref:uncharacterized protein LOC135084250 isoform X1 n=1 Tax=Ostrinia nubilalis TaxID=29057 RepID=UPI003082509E